jgi:hypothetical protein
MQDASLDGARGNFAAVAIEQRQFPAGLRQATLQIAPLRLGRPQRRRIIVVRFGTGHGTFYPPKSLKNGEFVSSLRFRS